MLTAATQIATRVAVLGSGAADYLAKPMASRSLLGAADVACDLIKF